MNKSFGFGENILSYPILK